MPKSKTDKINVLVVAAHPDDEVLGCGGTICRHTAEGAKVSILILGEGITSRGPESDRGKSRPALETLKDQARAAAQQMGAAEIFFARLPDNRFDSVDLLDLVKEVEKIKAKVRPRLVYTHHAGDLNIDHRLTHQAVVTAFRPLPGEVLEALYAFEVLSSTEWQTGIGDVFRPDHYVDISGVLSQKIKTLRCYESELCPFPHPRSIEAMEALARLAGSQAGLTAAERFRTVRSIRRIQHSCILP